MITAVVSVETAVDDLWHRIDVCDASPSAVGGLVAQEQAVGHNRGTELVEHPAPGCLVGTGETRVPPGDGEAVNGSLICTQNHMVGGLSHARSGTINDCLVRKPVALLADEFTPVEPTVDGHSGLQLHGAEVLPMTTHHKRVAVLIIYPLCNPNLYVPCGLLRGYIDSLLNSRERVLPG